MHEFEALSPMSKMARLERAQGLAAEQEQKICGSMRALHECL